jgi:hypothetical protein
MLRARSGDQPEVPFIGGKGRPYRAGPTQPLKPGRDLGVIQIRVVAAVAADELEQPGVAAFATAGTARGGRVGAAAPPSCRGRADQARLRGHRLHEGPAAGRGDRTGTVRPRPAGPQSAGDGPRRQDPLDSLDPPPWPVVPCRRPRCGQSHARSVPSHEDSPVNAQPCRTEQSATMNCPHDQPVPGTRRPGRRRVCAASNNFPGYCVVCRSTSRYLRLIK